MQLTDYTHHANVDQKIIDRERIARKEGASVRYSCFEEAQNFTLRPVGDRSKGPVECLLLVTNRWEYRWYVAAFPSRAVAFDRLAAMRGRRKASGLKLVEVRRARVHS